LQQLQGETDVFDVFCRGQGKQGQPPFCGTDDVCCCTTDWAWGAPSRGPGW
jgi:hypothetical protein